MQAVSFKTSLNSTGMLLGILTSHCIPIFYPRCT